ncbi:UNVERIFIED_CONTAM: Secreted RxLR effector protein [Sesamum latifolium]|uniref:Secreted RxLR effector protein n=1 Tax=Sesamum latifolium TaxID=2727402 RepID=A0AAW2TC36_9LAMI
MFLIYGGGELILEGYSDASFQSDDDKAKSQLGFVFKLNGGVVAWKSSKQDTTTDSTTEAEYIVALEAAKEAIWMKNYIQELGVVPSIAEPVVIFCDNNGAIAQAKEPRSHHRSSTFLDATIYSGRWLAEVTAGWTESAQQKTQRIHLLSRCRRPIETTVQQLDRALDGGHEINCLGLGLKYSKSRTSRMGIESPVETCVNLTELTPGDRHMESPGGLVGMTRVPGSDSTGVVLGLENHGSYVHTMTVSWVSARDDCIPDVVIISLIRCSQSV